MASKNELHSFSNKSTNSVRLYLRNMQLKFLDITYEETVEEIRKILEGDIASRWLCHNVLFLHINLKELEDRKTDMKYFALINLDWDPISPGFYIDAVLRCRLHEYFLQMCYAARSRKFSLQLLSHAVQRITVAEGSEAMFRLTKEEWLLYISTLPRFCQENAQFLPDYTSLWSQLVSHFLEIEIPNQQMSVMNKVEILIRAAGIMCSKVEDYKGGSEISDSIKEIDFNPFGQMYDSLSFRFFSEMFSNFREDMRDATVCSEVLQRLQHYISNLQFDEKDENAQIFLGKQARISMKTSRILRYIGDCSYLTNLILNKNIIQCTNPPPLSKLAVEEIQLVTNLLEKFKSKCRYEDYNERTMNFDQFCARLVSNLKHRHSQSSWHEKFITYEEAFTTPDGVSLAEKIAPAVSVDLGLKMVKKILRMTPPLSDPVKNIALTLIFDNKKLYLDFDRVVKTIFKSGLHDVLCTSKFQEELNQFNSKLGSEGLFCLKTRTLTVLAVTHCRRVTIQNPFEAAENLLLRILQLPLCASSVLDSLGSFWGLSVPKEKMQELNIRHQSLVLLEYCLIRMIRHVVDPLNRHQLLKSHKLIQVVLEHGWITQERFQELLLDIISCAVKSLPIDELVSLLLVYKEFIVYVISLKRSTDGEFFRHAYIHAVGFREATYFSSVECHSMRDAAIEIENLILEYDKDLVKASLTLPEDAASLSNIQLFLFYTRSPKWRDAIKSFVRCQWASIPDVRIQDLEEIIYSSSAKEWSGILEILFLLMSAKFREEGASKFLRLIAQVPLFEVVSCKTIGDDHDVNSKKKKRYVGGEELNSSSLIFQRFGSHLVDVLTSPEDPFKFRDCPNEQLELVKIFVAVSCFFPDEPQYFSLKQMSLMSLLNLVTWIFTNNEDEHFRKQFLVIVSALEKAQHGKLDPICKSIIEVLKPKVFSMLGCTHIEAFPSVMGSGIISV